jgi:hypothetical protein
MMLKRIRAGPATGLEENCWAVMKKSGRPTASEKRITTK